MKRDWSIFLASVFFVLGFSVVFSILGVILQGALLKASASIITWLSRIGGILIIFFGIYLTGLIKIPYLEKEHKFKIKKVKSGYLTSFVFGAAFAVGWTPCIGAILGGILSLAITQPSSAFLLLMTYSLGLGIPFLIVGLFAQKTKTFVTKFEAHFKYLRILFGIFLIAIGILVFLNNLQAIANLSITSEFLFIFESSTFVLNNNTNLIIAFIAGLLSFLSPCILPLIPAYLTYLGALIVDKH